MENFSVVTNTSIKPFLKSSSSSLKSSSSSLSSTFQENQSSSTFPPIKPLNTLQMDKPKFVIEAAEASTIAKQSNLTLPQLLPTLLTSTKPLARTPISHYPVSVAALGISGRIFLGVNLEFPSLPLHHTVHAEQFLITNLILRAEPKLTHLAVSAPPCGNCRQFLQEIRSACQIDIHVTHENNNDHVYTTLEKFLPHRFGPHDLLDKKVPLLLEKHANGVSFLDTQNLSNESSKGCKESFDIELRDAALEAANMAHAPYSECPSGVALRDCEGKVYKGFYVESAAYNPSLGPVQAALVAYIAAGGEGYERIVEAVLVERKSALIVQENTARMILQAVAPQCEFSVFHCVSGGDESNKAEQKG